MRWSGPARRTIAAAVVALLGLLAGGCGGGAKPAPRIDAVFLIVIDTLRPDVLSCYGYKGMTTARIDSLAAAGVRFENTESPASWTVPAMGSILTSRYPTQLGLVESPPARDTLFQWHDKRAQVRYTIPPGVTTLASLMDDAGFHPVAFVNQPFLNAGEGFEQGFAEWCYSTGEDSIRWHDTRKPIPNIAFPRGTDLATADPLLVAECGKWLHRNADRRPFVWIHLLRPHRPYTPLLKYLPENLRDPKITVDPAIRYAAEVREVDDMVGDLLASIDATVGLQHSLVIFTADHGEEFMDHGMRGHGHSLHREVIHVPLIFAGPSIPAGRTISTYTTTLDLAPTILELVGAANRAPQTFQGRSLLPVIDGATSTARIFSEGMLYGGTKRSLIEGGFKLMFDGQASPPYTLFDIAHDPFETADVAAAQAPRAARMEQTLTQHTDRVVSDLKASFGGTPYASSPETERILQAMRSLGYVGGK